MSATRVMYQPTEKQVEKWARLTALPMPSDDEIKARWKKAHHGKLAGWGMLKRDLAIQALRNTPEYQSGIWQGRVDAARGLPYSEERNDGSYNLGYHEGYTGYESNRRGWDAAMRATFDAKYINGEG